MVAVSSFLFSAPTVKNAEPKASQAPEKNTAALNTSESEDSAAPAAENAGKDTVKISKAAQALLDPEVQYYSQFMVAREGFDISALSIAIVNPGAEGISKGKTLSETAQAARASLNERYGAMAAQGQPFDYNSWEGADWNTLMGGLDRRALLAVKTNEGGMFSLQEQEIAESIMYTQRSLATGQYSGPERLRGNFRANPDPYDVVSLGRKGINWLEKVSDDEKRTLTWAVDRATAQSFANSGSKDSRRREDISQDPLVNLIAKAMETMSQSLERATWSGRADTVKDLKQAPWFKGFESQLDQIIASGRYRLT
ncbi:hypothetical protein [Elstera sp.]|jgi:hypothetical protein|uniref:hypothetical protein n=1 Tax=Elstera sp. TaxID=1916664 RepID=UPI0037BE4DAD